MRNDRRYPEITGLVLLKSSEHPDIASEKGNNGVRVEEKLHRKKLSSGRACSEGLSLASRAKSSSTGPTTDRNQSQSCATGSRSMPLPWRRMRTSPQLKRYRFGSRTACERPDQKIFAFSKTVPQFEI